MQRRQLLAAGAGASLFRTSNAHAEAGVNDAEVSLGQTGVLSGPLGVTVKSMLAGAQLAFDDVNSHGGVFGRAIRLTSLDDELLADKAVANYERLLKDSRTFAFFGCVGSGTTAAAAKLLLQSGAPLVGAYGVADSAREKVKGAAYFLRATTGREAQVLARHLTTIGIAHVGMAHLDNLGGREALAVFETALASHGVERPVAAAFRTDGSNLAAAAAALAGKRPQAVVMYLGGALPGELMKALWAAQSHPIFYGMSVVPGELTAKIVGAQARGLAIAQVVPYPWAEADSVAREYRRLAQLAAIPLDYYGFEGYLSALLMIEALRRCGHDLTRTRLHAVLRTLKMRLGRMEVDFSGDRATGSSFVELVQVTAEGRFVR